jgi:hypothetical protein
VLCTLKRLPGFVVPTPTLLFVVSTWKVGVSTVTSPLNVAVVNVVGVGTRAASRVPVVIFAASKFGTRAASRVPVVIFAASKFGTRATSRVPDPRLAALSAVSSEPSPKNEPAVTFPVTTTFEAAVNEVITFTVPMVNTPPTAILLETYAFPVIYKFELGWSVPVTPIPRLVEVVSNMIFEVVPTNVALFVP